MVNATCKQYEFNVCRQANTSLLVITFAGSPQSSSSSESASWVTVAEADGFDGAVSGMSSCSGTALTCRQTLTTRSSQLT